MVIVTRADQKSLTVLQTTPPWALRPSLQPPSSSPPSSWPPPSQSLSQPPSSQAPSSPRPSKSPSWLQLCQLPASKPPSLRHPPSSLQPPRWLTCHIAPRALRRLGPLLRKSLRAIRTDRALLECCATNDGRERHRGIRNRCCVVVASMPTHINDAGMGWAPQLPVSVLYRPKCGLRRVRMLVPRRLPPAGSVSSA